MTLVLGQAEAEELRAHARRTYPEECIGILGGSVDDAARRVTRVVPLANARTDSRNTRSLIAATDYRSVERELSAQGLDLIGFYHSHPDHPAHPSDYDRENALPWHTYVIVRVVSGEPTEMTAWQLTDDRGGFAPEAIVVPQAEPVRPSAGADRVRNRFTGGDR